MTIAPHNPATVRLADNDHIVGRGDRELCMTEFALPWSLGVSFHLRPETPVTVRVYESEDRAVIRLGGFSADLDVFAGVDQLDRLINVLTAARERLR